MKFFFCKFIVFSTFFLFLNPVLADSLNEKELLIRALTADPALELIRLDASRDSLLLAGEKAGWFPEATIDASANLDQEDYPGAATFPNQSQIRAEAGASVNQWIPGGGQASASLYSNRNIPLGDGSGLTQKSNGGEIRLTQPLLQGAWGYGPVHYSIRLQSLQNQASQLSRINRLIAELTDIRLQYWQAWEATRLTGSARNQVEYAREFLNAEKIRFQIGEASEIDTLSAQLQLLRAEKQLLDAQSRNRVARQKLAATLVLDSLPQVDTTTVLEIPEAPETDSLWNRIQVWDPDLRRLQVVLKKFQVEQGKLNNSLLPAIDATTAYGWQTTGVTGAEVNRRGGTLGLLLNWQIPNMNTRYQKKINELNQRSNEMETSLRKLDLKQNLSELIVQWERDVAALQVARASRDVARKQWLAAQAAYEVGEEDRLFLLQAQQDYYQSIAGFISQQAVLKRAEAVLDQMTGWTLDKFGVSWQ